MTASTAEIGRTRAWLMAARPQTLPAGIAPVLVGVGLAVAYDVFAPIPAAAALVGALLIQIGTNFANDYYDAVKGADTDDREGFTRVTAGGLIEPASVRRAMIVTYALALLVGVYLVSIGGLPIVIVGLSSILAGILYTGGPYPYGYRGLGDFFVFVYFGFVAVIGTHYVQAVASSPLISAMPLWLPNSNIPIGTILASVAPGCLATCILVVNNIRDMETDAAAGKRTLAVMIGYRWSRLEFLALVTVAYLVPVLLVFVFDSLYVLAPLLSVPLAVSISRTVLERTDGEALNPALERVGQLLFAHSILFAAGLALPSVL